MKHIHPPRPRIELHLVSNQAILMGKHVNLIFHTGFLLLYIYIYICVCVCVCVCGGTG